MLEGAAWVGLALILRRALSLARMVPGRLGQDGGRASRGGLDAELCGGGGVRGRQMRAGSSCRSCTTRRRSPEIPGALRERERKLFRSADIVRLEDCGYAKRTETSCPFVIYTTAKTLVGDPPVVFPRPFLALPEFETLSREVLPWCNCMDGSLGRVGLTYLHNDDNQ